MGQSNKNPQRLALVVALWAACSASGCAPSASDLAASSEGLYEAPQGSQLAIASEEVWTEAASGCEGLLDGDEHYALVSVEYGLVVALEPDETVVCIDTIGAVQDELEDSGLVAEAEQLDADFRTTAGATPAHQGSSSCRYRRRSHAGDPDPEPNLGWNRLAQVRGNPDPEPNLGF